MIVTVTFNETSVNVVSSEPLPREILANIAGSLLVRAKMGPVNGVPVRFVAEYTRSRHADNSDGPTHTFEIKDRLP